MRVRSEEGRGVLRAQRRSGGCGLGGRMVCVGYEQWAREARRDQRRGSVEEGSRGVRQTM